MENGRKLSAEKELFAVQKEVEDLLVYKHIRNDEIFNVYLGLLQYLGEALAGRKGRWNTVVEAYRRVFLLLAEKTELYPAPGVGDPWQNHLLDLIIEDENVFSKKAQHASISKMGSSLRETVKRELYTLRQLLRFDGVYLETVFQEQAVDGTYANLPSWQDLRPLGSSEDNILIDQKTELKRELFHLEEWSDILEKLARYYLQAGTGLFARYRAFRWVANGDAHSLEGVAHPDPIRLEELVGYERERRRVMDNTEQFLAGFPANNVLLYGERGTGKSSTVKGLLHRYARQGLRLVEIGKRHLHHFPSLLRILRGKPQKFIIFIDDLSFDEQEVEYKELKAILEGSIERRPDNVLIYATSNRRHLIREYFRDQEEGPEKEGEELRLSDTVQEKLSLAERFGLTVVFPTPNQKEYLNIVEVLAEQEGLAVEKEQLHKKALEWAMWQNGRSGRTARQFIDYLSGKMRFDASSGEWLSHE